MRVQTSDAAAPVRSQQAMTIDLAELLGLKNFSQLTVEIVQRGDVKPALAVLSTMQPAAGVPAILTMARTAANAGPAPILPGRYQLSSARWSATREAATRLVAATPAIGRSTAAISELTQAASLRAVTQAAKAATTAYSVAGVRSRVETAAVSPSIAPAAAVAIAAGSSASASPVSTRAATRPASQQVASTQRALQQSAAAAAMPAVTAVSAGRPAPAARSTQRPAGRTLAVTAPSGAGLSTAQRTA